MTGTLFLIVGPSGVGKDTLVDGARDALSGSRWFRFVRRVITRPADAGGEDHQAATEDEFEELRTNGAFLHHWCAHGLRYGIPEDVRDDLVAGVNVTLNTSRNEIEVFRRMFANVVVIHITASRETVKQRLHDRKRESEGEIAHRLARLIDHPELVDGALKLYNDGTIQQGIDGLVDLIAGSCNLNVEIRDLPVEFGVRPFCILSKKNPIASRLLAGSERVTFKKGDKAVVADLGWTDTDEIIRPDQCVLSKAGISALGVSAGATALVERSPTPQSRAILRKKIRGGHLSDVEISEFVDELVSGRFSASEIAGFLVAASTNLSIDEVVALTKARANYAQRLNWEADTVVDKHSMGGIPGNRITPIVIPIVAAFGLTMPKTSSRAITSAAGTADMMEVIARVDLTPEEMQRVVRETGACIAWNGRLTHSPVDDVMNSINRPLGLASSLLDVTSILSKKLAAGSTHVLIDLPVGPQAKTKTQGEAEALKILFETVGKGVGLQTIMKLTDGTRPIGNGIGPVLETVDVFKVLRNDPSAPQDLLEKALDYAATILEWAGGVECGRGRDIALGLIRSGSALNKLNEIAMQQTAIEQTLLPGQFTWELEADRSGRIGEIDIEAVSSIARAAGAPRDKAAGVFLSANAGSVLEKRQPILCIHSSSQIGLNEARETAKKMHPVRRWS